MTPTLIAMSSSERATNEGPRLMIGRFSEPKLAKGVCVPGNVIVGVVREPLKNKLDE
jgi:hypothetical protein